MTKPDQDLRPDIAQQLDSATVREGDTKTLRRNGTTEELPTSPAFAVPDPQDRSTAGVISARYKNARKKIAAGPGEAHSRIDNGSIRTKSSLFAPNENAGYDNQTERYRDIIANTNIAYSLLTVFATVTCFTLLHFAPDKLPNLKINEIFAWSLLVLSICAAITARQREVYWVLHVCTVAAFVSLMLVLPAGSELYVIAAAAAGFIGAVELAARFPESGTQAVFSRAGFVYIAFNAMIGFCALLAAHASKPEMLVAKDSQPGKLWLEVPALPLNIWSMGIAVGIGFAGMAVLRAKLWSVSDPKDPQGYSKDFGLDVFLQKLLNKISERICKDRDDRLDQQFGPLFENIKVDAVIEWAEDKFMRTRLTSDAKKDAERKIAQAVADFRADTPGVRNSTNLKHLIGRTMATIFDTATVIQRFAIPKGGDLERTLSDHEISARCQFFNKTDKRKNVWFCTYGTDLAGRAITDRLAWNDSPDHHIGRLESKLVVIHGFTLVAKERTAPGSNTLRFGVCLVKSPDQFVVARAYSVHPSTLEFINANAVRCQIPECLYEDHNAIVLHSDEQRDIHKRLPITCAKEEGYEPEEAILDNLKAGLRELAADDFIAAYRESQQLPAAERYSKVIIDQIKDDFQQLANARNGSTVQRIARETAKPAPPQSSNQTTVALTPVAFAAPDANTVNNGLG